LPVRAHISSETLRLPPVEIDRVRELIRQPRLYNRRRVEEYRFENADLVRVDVTQTILIPALLDDFDPDVVNRYAGISNRDALDILLTSHKEALKPGGLESAPRLVTLGFFQKRPYPTLEARGADGSALAILSLREAARLFATFLLVIYRRRYGDDGTGNEHVEWAPVKNVLLKDLVPLIRKPPKDPGGYPAADGWSDEHLDNIQAELTKLADAGNSVAQRMQNGRAVNSQVYGTLTSVSRATHRFAIVNAAPGDRIVVSHRYREPKGFVEVEEQAQPLRWYSPLASLGVVPKHVNFKARNHSHTHSFTMMVNAPPGTTAEFCLWSQRHLDPEVPGQEWVKVLVDDVSKRGPVAQISCRNHEGQDRSEQVGMEFESTGVATAGFQIQRRGLARDAAFVGGLLTVLLAIGVVFPEKIVASKGSAASLVLVFPATATALLAQRLHPVTELLGSFIRKSLLIMALVGFLAAAFGGVNLVSPRWVVMLSALGLVVCGFFTVMLLVLAFRLRSRSQDWTAREPVDALLRRDVEGARRLMAIIGGSCVAVTLVLTVIGLYRT
jgi:hypothetical protein